MTAIQLNDIIEQFQIEGQVLSCAPYGDGHINDTYLIVTTVRKYIMQRINNLVFRDVDLLMSNIDKVLSHAKKSILAQGGNPEREAMTLVHTINGDKFYRNGDKLYRMYIFIDKTVLSPLIVVTIAPPLLEITNSFSSTSLCFFCICLCID